MVWLLDCIARQSSWLYIVLFVMVVPSFLVKSKPSVFEAMPLPALESIVRPVRVVFLQVTRLNVRKGMFLIVSPDIVELMTFCRRKKTGRMMFCPCFQYQDPCPSRKAEL